MARVQTNTYAAVGQLLAGPGTLVLVTGFNASLTLRYFQLFDKAAVLAPGDIPVQSFPVGGLVPFSWAPSPMGAPFGASCRWGISSTPQLYTAAAELFWVHGEANSQ